MNHDSVAVGGASLVRRPVSFHEGIMSSDIHEVHFYHFHSPHFADKTDGYTGLYNSGSTCYLNSFLQSLYFVPQFREAVFQWRFQKALETPEESPALQFQRLFALMCKSEIGALPTLSLTRSLGWSDEQLHEQQDVQELYHILFDVLQRSYEQSPLGDVVKNGFTGRMETSITCHSCHTQRTVREESFIDLSIPVQGCTSLEDSFRLFTAAEELSASNAVLCPTCQSKQPCAKGICVTHLPPVLVLQLQRFKMDWTTMQRVKVSSRLEIPHQLDVQSLGLDTSSESDSKSGEQRQEVRYDLCSILMHTGQAQGGHYFAYCFDPYRERWVQFNDTSTTVLTAEQAQQLKCGASLSADGAFSSDEDEVPSPAEHAYMLLYRKHQPDMHASTPPDVPAAMMEEVATANAAYRMHKAEHDRLQGLISATLHYADATTSIELSDVQADGSLTTLRALVEPACLLVASRRAKLTETKQTCVVSPPTTHIRLRCSEPTKLLPARPLLPASNSSKSNEAAFMESLIQKTTLRDLKLLPFQRVDLFVESKDDYVNGTFPVYDTGKLNLRLAMLGSNIGVEQYPCFCPSSDELMPQWVSVSLDAPVSTLRKEAALLLSVSCERVGLILLTDAGAELFADDNATIRSNLRLVSGDIVHVELCNDYRLLTTDTSAVAQRSMSAMNLISLTVRSETREEPWEVNIDIRSTVEQLRERLASDLQLDPKGFKILGAFKREVKGSQRPLSYFGLVPGSGKGRRGEVDVVLGTPLEENEMELVLLRDTLTLARASADTESKEAQRFAVVGSYVMRGHWSLKQLEEFVTCQLEAAATPAHERPAAGHMRFRPLKGGKLGAPFRSDRSLKQNCLSLRDGEQLVVQSSVVPEEIGADSIMLNVVCSDMSRVEVAVSKRSSLQELKESLARVNAAVTQQHGPADSVAVARLSKAQIAALDSGKEMPRKALQWLNDPVKAVGRPPLSLRQGDTLHVAFAQ